MASTTDIVPEKKQGDLQLGSFTLSRCGVEIEGSPPFEEWQGVVEFAKRAESGVMWWLGDLLNYGERQYGEMYSQVCEETGYAYDTVRRARQVAAEYEIGMRIPTLSFTHHLYAQGLEPEEQREWLERASEEEMSASKMRQAIKKAKAEAKYATIEGEIEDIDERCSVLEGDFTEVGSEIGDESVDWIITDPPYPEEFLHVYSDLSSFARRVLKPGGSLICMVGQSYLPRIIEMLSERMSYHWMAAYMTPGGQAVQLWDREVLTFWKPLLWFTKGEYEGDWVGDVCKSEVNDNDKRFHHWGQSETGMADIVGRWTRPDDLICDPFCGGGTTGVVSVRMNRRFIGIDIDPEKVSISKARINEECARADEEDEDAV